MQSPSPPEASSSRTRADDAQEVITGLRLSYDGTNGNVSPDASGKVAVNGRGTRHSQDSDVNGEDTMDQLRAKLEASRKEKDALSTQYADLLAKFNTVKTTLGTKLRQFAEELDRREQAIQQLSVEKDDLQQTVETLQSEVMESNAEAERASRELMTMRNRALEESSEESLTRERELRELQVELEHCRSEKDEWEREALEGRVSVDEARSLLEGMMGEWKHEKELRLQEQRELEIEKERTSNLQSVLEDFQSAKNHEIQNAVREKEALLVQISQNLAEFKHRAHTAEMALEESSGDSSKTAELEKQVKEKSLLVEKLRHEGVIMNEHLMEALRRLRKNATDNNVDRRLVTNVLLQFITTPRADAKRFEMLSLLASILSWNDSEREKAGLQRSSQSGSKRPGSRTVSAQHMKGKAPELENTDETESFSQRWVEFLLKESNSSDSTSGTLSPPSPLSPSRTGSNQSLPGSPKGHSSPLGRASRLASFTSLAMASTPDLGEARPSR